MYRINSTLSRVTTTYKEFQMGGGMGLVIVIGTSGTHQWINGYIVDIILTLNAVMRVKQKYPLESIGNRCWKRVDTLRIDDNYTTNETHR